MAFTSLEFALFLSIVFILYWTVFKTSAQSQNIWLVVTSLVFYGWASLHFLWLLIFSTIFNYYTGEKIGALKSKLATKLALGTGIAINLGILCYFKYLTLCKDCSFTIFGTAVTGVANEPFNVLLPLGISFYTFQTLSYLIDIHNEEIKPCRNILLFATYLTYFPKIVAGPIEPPGKFFPQIVEKRAFNYALAVDGIRQILWGLFVKIVIANNCASFTTPIFGNYQRFPGSTLLLAAFFYLFQVYCDFSGYSNMAIGISKLFGIRLMRNFSAPFFSTNISEYWKKWHISLTTWAMKYVFTPLSFALRRYKRTGAIVSIIITFAVIGIWHGPKSTYLVFGLLHGLYFIPLFLLPKTKVSGHESSKWKAAARFGKMFALFLLIMFTCIFFGSESVSQGVDYIKTIFSSSVFSSLELPILTGKFKAFMTIFFISFLLTAEWVQKGKQHELQLDNVRNPLLRRAIYYTLLIIILFFGSVNHIEFIYAQF